MSAKRGKRGEAKIFAKAPFYHNNGWSSFPKKDGREVLAQIKADNSFKLIPVLILTTSAASRDILKTYELNANCYITKPIDLDQFICVVKLIEKFWLDLVRLPSIYIK